MPSCTSPCRRIARILQHVGVCLAIVRRRPADFEQIFAWLDEGWALDSHWTLPRSRPRRNRSGRVTAPRSHCIRERCTLAHNNMLPIAALRFWNYVLPGYYCGPSPRVPHDAMSNYRFAALTRCARVTAPRPDATCESPAQDDACPAGSRSDTTAADCDVVPSRQSRTSGFPS